MFHLQLELVKLVRLLLVDKSQLSLYPPRCLRFSLLRIPLNFPSGKPPGKLSYTKDAGLNHPNTALTRELCPSCRTLVFCCPNLRTMHADYCPSTLIFTGYVFFSSPSHTKQIYVLYSWGKTVKRLSS